MSKRSVKRSAEDEATGSTKCHKNNLNYLWMDTYKAKAKYVQVSVQTRQRRNSEQVFFDLNLLPKSVTFYTCPSIEDDPIGYKYVLEKTIVDSASLEEILKTLGLDCNTTIADDSWNMMIEALQAARYTAQSTNTPEQGGTWVQTECLDKPSLLSNLSYLQMRFHKAILSSINNGDAKQFLEALLRYIEVDKLNLPPRQIIHFAPSNSSESNGRILMVPIDSDISYADYTRPTSPASWMEGSDDFLYAPPKQCTVVPDYVVLSNEDPGRYILNFECKKADGDGIVQCIKQVLTQMHLQPFGLGIVLNGRGWTLLVLHKTNTSPSPSIQIRQYTESFIPSVIADTYILDIQTLTNLATWVYRIVKWQLE